MPSKDELVRQTLVMGGPAKPNLNFRLHVATAKCLFDTFDGLTFRSDQKYSMDRMYLLYDEMEKTVTENCGMNLLRLPSSMIVHIDYIPGDLVIPQGIYNRTEPYRVYTFRFTLFIGTQEVAVIRDIVCGYDSFVIFFDNYTLGGGFDPLREGERPLAEELRTVRDWHMRRNKGAYSGKIPLPIPHTPPKWYDDGHVRYTIADTTCTIYEWCEILDLKIKQVKKYMCKKDMDFRTALAEAMREKERKGGVVSRPHTLPRKKYTYKGVTMTVAAWSREYGQPRWLIEQRLARGWPFDLAISCPARGTYYVNGEPVRIGEAARRLGCKPDVLRMRLAKGWSVEDAFTKPVLGCTPQEDGDDDGS